MKEPSLLILAAGLGSRYGGFKQMDPVDEYGNIIIDYSIHDAISAGFERIICVIKKEMEQDFRETIGGRIEKFADVVYSFQEIDMLPKGYEVPEGRVKPWGTSHTLLCARDVLDGPFAVINADDYYGRGAYEKLYYHLTENTDAYEYAMVGYDIEMTLSDHGEVTRGICEVGDDGYLRSILEIPGIRRCGEGGAYTANGREVLIKKGTAVSMNMWAFKPTVIGLLESGFPSFLDNAIKTNPLKCEYLLPTAMEDITLKGDARIKVLEGHERWFGITYREDMALVRGKIRDLKRQGIYKERLWRE